MGEKARLIFSDFQQRTSGKGLKHEELLVVDKDGTVLFSKKGGANGVYYTRSDASKMYGACMIHNHPSHNSVLSPEDASSLYSEEKSCCMCDLDGKRMTFVYGDDVTLRQRIAFENAYSFAFQRIQK